MSHQIWAGGGELWRTAAFNDLTFLMMVRGRRERTIYQHEALRRLQLSIVSASFTSAPSDPMCSKPKTFSSGRSLPLSQSELYMGPAEIAAIRVTIKYTIKMRAECQCG